jgi:hypothetical protein
MTKQPEFFSNSVRGKELARESRDVIGRVARNAYETLSELPHRYEPYAPTAIAQHGNGDGRHYVEYRDVAPRGYDAPKVDGLTDMEISSISLVRNIRSYRLGQKPIHVPQIRHHNRHVQLTLTKTSEKDPERPLAGGLRLFRIWPSGHASPDYRPDKLVAVELAATGLVASAIQKAYSLRVTGANEIDSLYNEWLENEEYIPVPADGEPIWSIFD